MYILIRFSGQSESIFVGSSCISNKSDLKNKGDQTLYLFLNNNLRLKIPVQAQGSSLNNKSYRSRIYS